MSHTVGFIGAGRIGEPMVERLVATDHAVRVYARRAEVRDRLRAAGAEPVVDPVDVAKADVVISCLYSDEQMLEVVPPIVEAMALGSVFVSHTTGAPASLEQIASLAAPRDVAVVDASFSGDAAAVRDGRLTIYVGGEPAAVGVARKVLAAYADPIIETGGPGTALRTKLLNNLMFAAVSQLTLRAVAVANGLGITEDALLTALDAGSGGSTAARYIARSGRDAAAFADTVAPFLRKDVAVCERVAGELGVDVADLIAVARSGPIDVRPETSSSGL